MSIVARVTPSCSEVSHAPQATTQMSLRMDEDVKRAMDAIANAIGITSAAAMNIFARQFE